METKRELSKEELQFFKEWGEKVARAMGERLLKLIKEEEQKKNHEQPK